MASTRKSKIMEYINEWHTGFWNMTGTVPAEAARRVADNVVVYFDLDASRVHDYTAEAQKLIDNGTIKLKTDSHGWAFIDNQ